MVWPALPAIPLIEETQTIRPFSSQQVALEQRVVDPLLAGEVDLHQQRPALLVHAAERLVAGDAGVVDDDVDAAVGGLERVADLRRRLGVGDVGDDRESRRSSW